MGFLHFLHEKLELMVFFMLTISSQTYQSQAQIPFLTSLESLCDGTFYSRACLDSLSPLLDTKKSYDPQFIYDVSMKSSIDEVSRVFEDFSGNGVLALERVDRNEKILLSALETCRDLLSSALYNLNMSVCIDDGVVKARARADFRTWLSAARSDLQACVDSFEHAPDRMRKVVAAILEKSAQLVGTSLGIMSMIDEYMNLREGEPSTLHKHDGLDILTSDWKPSWTSLQHVKPNVVVAADGSGNYRTINEAINVVPPMSDKRFVIYVKKGVYLENVVVGMNKWNILMYGDGMYKTVVSSNRCNVTGSSTVQSATFAVRGTGFIAMDIGFRNTAGPHNGQAVALFSASDRSVFYRCLMDGYQDTLFAQSHRQFYRECHIYGTIDFIFGDAAVVIQNSNIYVKRGISNSNVITAQGKDLPQSISGISIQNCTILPADNLDGVATFLGRPWKAYSTTVIMESKLGSLIDPRGWRAWNEYAPAPDTILYVEYKNEGPGSDTTKRVQWKGVKVKDTEGYARKYTVRSFIGGTSWLPSTGVPFQPDLRTYSYRIKK